MPAARGEPRGGSALDECQEKLRQCGILLAESEIRFHGIVEMSSDGVLVVDTRGEVCFANPAAEKLLGARQDDLLGQEFGWPVVVGESTELEITRGGDTTVLEMRVARTDWQGDWASLANLRDVTDRTRLAQQQQDAIRSLREVDDMRKQFVATVSHDLRSPLGVIQGWAEILRKQWSNLTDERKLEIIDRIAVRGRFMGNLVRGLLDVSRLEEGGLPFEVSPFDMRSAIDDVIGDVDDMIGNEIRVRIPPDLPPILGDRDRHWQVLTNLLSNASKFSPSGVAIEVEATLDGEYVQVDVRDWGRGISPEDHQKLFKKYSRLPESRGDKTSGTGLGLYICKTIVEAQGGRIWVDGGPGGGATFSYTLPVAT